MRKLILSTLFMFTICGALALLFSSCAEEEKKPEQPAVTSAETAKTTEPVAGAVDIEAEKSAILEMFNKHSAAVNANRGKGAKNLDDIFQHWVHDNSKSVAFYSTVTFGAPEDSSAETWPSVKKLWETLLTSGNPSAVSHYQSQQYVANLSEFVIKASRASGVGSGRWGAGQNIQQGKLVALFLKRGGNWYIQALEMNASPQGNRLQPLEP